MWRGGDAWLMLLQPSSHVVAMEANTCSSVGEGAGLHPKPTIWDKVVADFANVFKPPSMPADCDTVHHIELKPGSVPPFRW